MPGRERERNAALPERFRHREAVMIAQRYIENGCIDPRRSHEFERLPFCVGGSNGLMTILGEQIAQHHGDERLVVDNQHTCHQITFEAHSLAQGQGPRSEQWKIERGSNQATFQYKTDHASDSRAHPGSLPDVDSNHRIVDANALGELAFSVALGPCRSDAPR